MQSAFRIYIREETVTHMKHVYLCGHTGSKNRGCEAIIRSTVSILKKSGISDIKFMTFDENFDRFLGLNKEAKLIPYPKKSFSLKALSLIKRKVFNNYLWGFKFFYNNLFDNIEKESVILNVGGDIYCSGSPYLSYTLNILSEKYKIPNIFWGCSVDDRVLSDKEMQQDINRYSYIITRETETFNNIKEVLNDSDKLFLTCDPAFHLEIQETSLPPNFIEGNTLGINLSNHFFENADNENDMTYINIKNLIDFVFSETDMNICLIPHVYTTNPDTLDLKILKKIYSLYKDTGRIGIVKDELSCTELKYIISKCRFFIGARTHAVIAAYSSEVPAIALSYSIKSIGIAKDIFGSSDGYAISRKELSSTDKLKNIFINTLINNENKIKERYKEFMPKYKQTIIDTAAIILGGNK